MLEANVQRSTSNVQRSTLNVQRSTSNAQRPTPNAQWQIGPDGRTTGRRRLKQTSNAERRTSNAEWGAETLTCFPSKIGGKATPSPTEEAKQIRRGNHRTLRQRTTRLRDYRTERRSDQIRANGRDPPWQTSNPERIRGRPVNRQALNGRGYLNDVTSLRTRLRLGRRF